jgi:hypothetical protein
VETGKSRLSQGKGSSGTRQPGTEERKKEKEGDLSTQGQRQRSKFLTFFATLRFGKVGFSLVFSFEKVSYFPPSTSSSCFPSFLSPLTSYGLSLSSPISNFAQSKQWIKAAPII